MEVVYCTDCHIHITRVDDEYLSEVDRRILCWSCMKNDSEDILDNTYVRTRKEGDT